MNRITINYDWETLGITTHIAIKQNTVVVIATTAATGIRTLGNSWQSRQKHEISKNDVFLAEMKLFTLSNIAYAHEQLFVVTEAISYVNPNFINPRMLM